MAGLLDSDWVKFLAAPRTYYADKRADQAAQEFQGLLGSLEQQGPADPRQPDGGLLAARAPDAQFWLKAAQIPGYAGLAGQQLGIDSQGTQAMGRQMQGQDFALNNMTLAQRQEQQLREQVAMQNYGIAQQDLARKQYGTMASAAASGASAQNSMITAQLNQSRLQEQQHKTGLLAAPVFDRLPAEQQVAGAEKLSIIDRAAAGAKDVANWAQNRATGSALPSALGSSEANVFKQEWQFGVKPVVMQMLNTGVLQPAEEEMVQALIGKPDDYMLTDSQLNSIQNMMQKVQDRRADMYKSYGLQAKPVGLGESSAARTLSKGKPAGSLFDVQERPGSNTVSGKVQRN